jgi:plastocyanin
MRGVPNGRHHVYAVLGFSDHLPYQAIGEKAGKPYGTMAELDFTVGPGQTQVIPETPSSPAAPGASPSAQAAAGTRIEVLGDPTTGGTYKPASATVTASDTVEWIWVDDSATHSVTDEGGKFDSGLLGKGAKFRYKFSSKGTYKYKCSVHPQMTGQVTVK